MTALLHRGLQHQDLGHGRFVSYPGCEHRLRIPQVAQITAEPGLLDVELRQGYGDVHAVLGHATRRHVGASRAGGQLGKNRAIAGPADTERPVQSR